MACVSELAPEVKAAAEGEHLAKAGRSDLHLPRQFEGCSRPRQHDRAFSTAMRGREKKYSLHEASIPAGALLEAKK
jgi:hypothetical protein